MASLSKTPSDSPTPDGDANRTRARRLRGRNLAVLFSLIAFIVLVYLITLVRLGGGE